MIPFATEFILLAPPSARKILGSHVWQAGASKYEDRARLDITHHRRLTRDVIELIESEVNTLILANHR